MLWDVDGTMVDSLDYHWLSWREALSGEGYTLMREQFLSTFGRRNDEILRTYFGDDISPERIARISLDKEEAYREMVRSRGIEALPGVRRWLARIVQEIITRYPVDGVQLDYIRQPGIATGFDPTSRARFVLGAAHAP